MRTIGVWPMVERMEACFIGANSLLRPQGLNRKAEAGL